MNIKEAKQEIQHTLQAYHRKDSSGSYIFPRVRQRPILLMGPPGIGKTAVMEQIASECGIGLVAYTLTHHTRQSAIGLPHLEERSYGGETFTVTEYTMSEIIASVYDCMEKTGKKEGILFIDEINCVSETLVPVMLQFLQNKTFGTHVVPEGWMIVAAGNPPEYNRSAREFDIVTLDRVRRIDVEPDCPVWMEYAWENGVHPAVLSYLSIHPERFYLADQNPDRLSFVTARGWEDLSEIIKSYEELSIPISEELVKEYIQSEQVSREFYAGYQLYEKYGTDYEIRRILEGSLTDEEMDKKISMARGGEFDERFTVVTLLLAALDQEFVSCTRLEKRLALLYQALTLWKTGTNEQSLEDFVKIRETGLQVKIEREIITPKEKEEEEWVNRTLQDYSLQVKKEHLGRGKDGLPLVRTLFAREQRQRRERVSRIQAYLTRGFDFLERCFGEGQEMVLFVSGLTRNAHAMEFISAHGSESYLRHSEKLLYRKQEKLLKEECRELMEDL